jgi:uncharacterized protein YkwD
MSRLATRFLVKFQWHCLAALTAIALTSSTFAADAVVSRVSNATVRARVVELVNVARSKSRKCGAEKFAAAPPLFASRQLDDAAGDHARAMARKNFFDHRGADGSQPKDRVSRAGYRSRLTGENIAFGPVSAEEVVAGWLASPGHCANIMESRFQHIGVGVATGRKRGRIYWVQEFGAPLQPPVSKSRATGPLDSLAGDIHQLQRAYEPRIVSELVEFRTVLHAFQARIAQRDRAIEPGKCLLAIPSHCIDERDLGSTRVR